MRIAVVVGTRPNLIKFAALAQPLAKKFTVVAIDTGQHYDPSLSGTMWDEFQIHKPHYRLEGGSGAHGEQTARMLEGIERIIVKEEPDGVIVFGDTNSALAGALAAAKIPLSVAHIEAGVRVSSGYLPEEVNRIVIDHVSGILFCPNKRAVVNLKREGITKQVHYVGDLLYQFLHNTAPMPAQALTEFVSTPGPYVLGTIHRAENTDNQLRLQQILEALGSLPLQVIFPMHPRTKAAVQRERIRVPKTVSVIDPVPYRVMISLQHRAHVIVTDSGGVQREAYYLGKPCVAIRAGTEWPETLLEGAVCVVPAERAAILQGYHTVATKRPRPPRLIGNTAERIVDKLEIYLRESAG